MSGGVSGGVLGGGWGEGVRVAHAVVLAGVGDGRGVPDLLAVVGSGRGGDPGGVLGVGDVGWRRLEGVRARVGLWADREAVGEVEGAVEGLGVDRELLSVVDRDRGLGARPSEIAALNRQRAVLGLGALSDVQARVVLDPDPVRVGVVEAVERSVEFGLVRAAFEAQWAARVASGVGVEGGSGGGLVEGGVSVGGRARVWSRFAEAVGAGVLDLQEQVPEVDLRERVPEVGVGWRVEELVGSERLGAGLRGWGRCLRGGVV